MYCSINLIQNNTGQGHNTGNVINVMNSIQHIIHVTTTNDANHDAQLYM